MSKLILVGPASPLRGGIADFNEALASELVNQGHEVIVVSFFAPRRRFTTRVPKKQFGGAGQALQAAPGAVLSRDRHRLPRRLDHALVDDIWDRRSQLHIDVWTIVTEHFCVRSPDTGLPLHPRMNAPFTAVRRFRFSSVSDPEDPDGGRSWHISQILGPKGFPPSDPRPTFPF